MAMLRSLSELVQIGRAATDWVSEGLSYVWTSYHGLGSYFEWTSYLGNWGPGDLKQNKQWISVITCVLHSKQGP